MANKIPYKTQRVETMKAMAKENTASFSLNMSENADNALNAFGKFFYSAPNDLIDHDLRCFCYLDPGILK